MKFEFYDWNPEELIFKWAIFTNTDKKCKKEQIYVNWKVLSIPNWIKKRITKILKSNELIGFDCINFARNVTWKKIEIESPNIKKNKNLVHLNIENLKVWDIIVFTKKEYKLNIINWNWFEFHFWVYIWWNKVIHKHWANCNIFISNILDFITYSKQSYPYGYQYKP